MDLKKVMRVYFKRLNITALKFKTGFASGCPLINDINTPDERWQTTLLVQIKASLVLK